VDYTETYRAAWDAFVRNSKNGTFLFFRDYIEYHQNRFSDNSLLIFKKEKLIALFPANKRADGTISSHDGLTYGGLVTGNDMNISLLLDIFDTLLDFFKTLKVKTLLYKQIPHIYHLYPAEEDTYALFRAGAKQISNDVSSSIRLKNPLGFSTLRKRGVKKALKNHVVVCRSDNWRGFWKILTENLAERYGVVPTHSLDEIIYLKNIFCRNISLYTASINQSIVAGLVIYNCGQTIHVQYIASNEIGKSVGAIDAIVNYLINEVFSEYEWFDFGISTTENGLVLNKGLSHQKELFGARTITYQQFSIPL
jgi:hypothetical protein